MLHKLNSPFFSRQTRRSYPAYRYIYPECPLLNNSETKTVQVYYSSCPCSIRSKGLCLVFFDKGSSYEGKRFISMHLRGTLNDMEALSNWLMIPRYTEGFGGTLYFKDNGFISFDRSGIDISKRKHIDEFLELRERLEEKFPKEAKLPIGLRKEWIRHTLYAYMGVQRLRYGTEAVQWKTDPKYVKAFDDRPISIN